MQPLFFFFFFFFFFFSFFFFFFFFFFVAQLKLWGSLHWWNVCVCDHLPSVQVVSSRLLVIGLVEEDHGKKMQVKGAVN